MHRHAAGISWRVRVFPPVSPSGRLTHTVAANRTVVNIHQGNTLNPWINYPYLTSAALRAAADECRQLGVRYS